MTIIVKTPSGRSSIILLVRHVPSLEVGLEDEAIEVQSNASSDRNDRPERAAGVACLHSTDLGKGFEPTDSEGRAHRVVCFAGLPETLAGPCRARIQKDRRVPEPSCCAMCGGEDDRLTSEEGSLFALAA